MDKDRLFDPSRKAVCGCLVVNEKSYLVETYHAFERALSKYIESVRKGKPISFPPELAKRVLKAMLKIYGKA
ncbi:MAG TPA: hypothetical protein ENO31_00265 [Thermoprotei archaeon]|nr:hypothetical protein [TACK group archaeon]HEV50970.1 hypothetical protein [Thermoprotei archaeon]